MCTAFGVWLSRIDAVGTRSRAPFNASGTPFESQSPTARSHSSATPFPFDVATAWAALEGSIVLWGLILAVIANMFIASGPLDFVISLAGVAIFTGLTAYDTQSIKNEYLAMRSTPGGEAYLQKGAVMGALRLYLDFLNMFMFLLQFMGDRR